MKKLAIIHTTPVTINSLKKLVNQHIPECEIINFLDDSILPQLIKNEGDISTVEDRVKQYIIYAEKAGADVILSACSSIGDIFTEFKAEIGVPVLRIDEPMIESAVEQADNLGVAATLKTTLKPTINLIRNKAESKNKLIEIESRVADSAYQKLIEGKEKEHDQILAEVLEKLLGNNDLVVLAQASMARAVKRLPEKKQDKFLTSPESGIKKVKTLLQNS
ncbi:MAG: aspartate/glutamate racemase family protein [Halanaerobiales bacterium]